jgi:hypothetical protein
MGYLVQSVPRTIKPRACGLPGNCYAMSVWERAIDGY